MNIVFMGTPDFAVASLASLVENGYNIVGVITAPDKPSGRGQKVSMSAVKEYALTKGLQILQPEKLKNEVFIEELKSLQADLQIVVAFRMLPEIVWNMPPLGTVNLHASLLPQYRGAAPINWAIINGEKETGVSTFFLQHEIDTGNTIFTEKTAIGEDETAGELHDRLMHIGADLILKTVQAIEQQKAPSTPQSMAEDLKSAPRIFKETCRINWEQDCNTIHNFIRGLSPYPAAFTTLNNLGLKIYKANKEIIHHNHAPGIFLSDSKNYFKIACKDGFLSILELQLEGKKRMGISEFLRGYKLIENGKLC